MGYAMHIIAPHQSNDPDDINCPLNHCELYDDPWYNDDASRQIWRCWRDYSLADGTKLPKLLGITLVHSPWSYGFRNEIDMFFDSNPGISEYAKDEVINYLDWIDFWNEKNAKFYLSI